MKKSIEKVALVLFLVAMICCAILALLSAWSVFGPAFYFLAPIIPSLFIIGLASFLIWLVIIILAVRDKVMGKE